MVIEAMLQCQKPRVVLPRDVIVSYQTEYTNRPKIGLSAELKGQKRDLRNAKNGFAKCEKWIY